MSTRWAPALGGVLLLSPAVVLLRQRLKPNSRNVGEQVWAWTLAIQPDQILPTAGTANSPGPELWQWVHDVTMPGPAELGGRALLSDSQGSAQTSFPETSESLESDQEAGSPVAATTHDSSVAQPEGEKPVVASHNKASSGSGDGGIWGWFFEEESVRIKRRIGPV